MCAAAVQSLSPPSSTIAIRQTIAIPPAGAPETLEVAGQRLTVFVESPPLLDSMVRDIMEARERVWLEVYIFFNDTGGARVADALKHKAREGLDVRVLYDAVGSVSTPEIFFQELRAAGVKVHTYHSLLEGFWRFRPLTILNRRDHRKLLIVDTRAGYFGGMNVIDTVETVEQLKTQDKPTSSGWRDVHIRLQGPQQVELAESFERSWRRALGETVKRKPRAMRREKLQQTMGPTADHEETIRFFDSGPEGKYSRAARVFVYLIKRARYQIMLSMAYFIPIGAVLRGMLSARRRGVRIRVVVPGKSDVKLVQRATAYLYDKLLRRGFRIYERKQRMLHSKMMVIDDRYTVVGSCNLDPRSLYINLEFLAVIKSQKFAAAMQRICWFEIEHSERITMEHVRRVGRFQRFLNSLAWSLRWWL